MFLKAILKYKQFLFGCIIGILIFSTISNLSRFSTNNHKIVKRYDDHDKTKTIGKLLKTSKINEPTTLKPTSAPAPPTKLKQSYDLNTHYPDLLKCKRTYNPWVSNQTVTGNPTNEIKDIYTQPASNDTHKLTVTRGVVVFFPIKSIDHFKLEFKWLYRSWIEMQKYEPKRWRTDLIIFLEKDEAIFANKDLFLTKLNCSFANLRKNDNDAPMCTLREFVLLPKRQITKQFASYERILNDLNIFSQNDHDLDEFYSLLNRNLNHYSYLNSILMAFDGYNYFKSAGFDYLIRSDIDVFLTPLFGTWLPLHCNDFIAGGGGYSSDFNHKRLQHIADYIGLGSTEIWNLGSTWISTPEQFRLVSYYTLFGMAYLSQEEFATPERAGALGTINWPEWHYGVLLLYGQSLGLNHLIATRQLNVVKLEGLVDFNAAYTSSIFKIIHIHVFQGADLFSKFAFKAGSYNNMTVSEKDSENVKYYALKMALEGKQLNESQLVKDLDTQIALKIF